MNKFGIEPDGELSSDQWKLVSQLTEREVQKIDISLLSNTNEKWQKVAMVVVATMLELPSRIDDIPDIYYSYRVKKLVNENMLEARGDLL
ncbi:MAG: DUF3658 domain-containing protein [Candidatus Thiodiazotropha sp. L084R]